MFEIKPLSLTIDQSGDETVVAINGTNYARNIAHGSVVVSSFRPEPTGELQAKVTVTFIVDELTIRSRNAGGEGFMDADGNPINRGDAHACGDVINVFSNVSAEDIAGQVRKARRGGKR